MTDLNDKEISKRRKGAIRKGLRSALVQVSLEVTTLRAADDNNERVEELESVDVLPLVSKVPSVSESSEDLVAIQSVIPDINKAQAERVGLAILRACLGA